MFGAVGLCLGGLVCAGVVSLCKELLACARGDQSLLGAVGLCWEVQSVLGKSAELRSFC